MQKTLSVHMHNENNRSVSRKKTRKSELTHMFMTLIKVVTVFFFHLIVSTSCAVCTAQGPT